MSGAPITVTLYKNGIHVTYSEPSLVTNKALRAEMQRAFDAKENVEAAIWNGSLTKLADGIKYAVDSISVEDKRDELFVEGAR